MEILLEDSTPALCILADKPSIDDVMNVLHTIERLVIVVVKTVSIMKDRCRSLRKADKK